jgi:hypothetical protein
VGEDIAHHQYLDRSGEIFGGAGLWAMRCMLPIK